MKEVMITVTAQANRYILKQVTDEEHAELVRVVTRGSHIEQADMANKLLDNVIGNDWDVDEGTATLDMTDA